MSDSVQIEEAGVTEQALPGECLKLARQSKGLAIADVASQLNLSCRYIQALEDSDFGVLPSAAFVKGYIRAYARCLEIPADELVGRFNDLYESADNQRPVKTVNKVRRQVKLGDPMVTGSVIVFFAILLGFMVWWWQTQYGASHPQSPSEEGGANPAATLESAPFEGTQVQGEETQEEASDLDSGSRDEPEEVLVSGESDQTVSEGSEEPNYLTKEEISRLQSELEVRSGEDSASSDKVTSALNVSQSEGAQIEGRLQMSFSDDCWITIKDASLKTVIAGIKKAGDTLDLQIRLPARLLIGRASSVSQALLDGEKLDLTELTSNDVARLLLK